MPGVGVAGDQVTTGPIGGRVQVGDGVEVEHTLAVEADEPIPAVAAVGVGVDANLESGPLVEGGGFGHVGHRQRRRRRHADLAEEPLEAIPAQLDVVARTERDRRLLLTTTGAFHRASILA